MLRNDTYNREENAKAGTDGAADASPISKNGRDNSLILTYLCK